MYAVILAGGKQYRVKAGEILSVERLNKEQGQKIDFNQVLLVEDGEDILVGTPIVDGAVVRAEILESYKNEKIIVFKKKRRKQYKRKKGHRQMLTRIRIEEIIKDKNKLDTAGLKQEVSQAKEETQAVKRKTEKVEKKPEEKTEERKKRPQRKTAPETKPEEKAEIKKKTRQKKK